MGGYYTAGTQRVDLLDRVSQESRNEKPPNRVGLFKLKGWKTTPLLLAGLRSPLTLKMVGQPKAMSQRALRQIYEVDSLLLDVIR